MTETKRPFVLKDKKETGEEFYTENVKKEPGEKAAQGQGCCCQSQGIVILGNKEK